MVFGFFTRKPAASPERAPLPESSTLPQSVTQPPVPPSLSHVPIQLRTPSPSVESSSVAHSAHPASPAPTTSNSSSSSSGPMHPVSSSMQAESSKDVGDRVASLKPPEPTPQSLSTLISSIPPKIVHSYILSHVPDASDDVIKTLATFFETLAPPPQLHCIRCHKDFVEVENDDRSCLVPHDDESAEVERVGLSAKREGRKDHRTTYETVWGCCGKTVEGDGDQGPPDGWCYEGRHTIDIKRARFRADSTPQDDKLVSCIRLNCHGIRSQLPRGSTRKCPHSSMNYKEASSDEGSEGEADSGMEEIVKKETGNKPKGKGKGKPKTVGEDKMEVDQAEGEEPEADSASRAGSAKGRVKGRGKAVVGASASATKRRGRAPKSKAIAKDTDDENVSVKSAPTTSKRRGRQPKSKAYIDDSDAETGQPRKSASVSASPARNAPPRTRSQSRTRGVTNTSKLENAKASAKPKSLARTATVVVPETEDEAEKPKKKRKTAA